jgi:hypothetical protein
MLQLNPDWRKKWTPEQFEKELRIKFQGPGIYVSEKDVLMVIPYPPVDNPDPNTIWHQKQPEGTIFEVNVYNCRFNETIFFATTPASREVVEL